MANEAVKYVWERAIPLQNHVHKSDVTSHPAPPPALVYTNRRSFRSPMRRTRTTLESLPNSSASV